MTITDITITAMQRPVVTFEAADPAPEEYTVTATKDGVVTTVLVPGTATVARFPQLGFGTYLFQVDDGDPAPATVVGNVSVAELLRQGVYDAVYNAAVPGLPTIFQDGRHQPVDVTDNEVMDAAYPALEVSAATLAESTVASAARCVETWAIPIRIWAQGQASDPQGVQALHVVRQQVQAAIHRTGNLGLGNRGVVDHSFAWRLSEELLDEHEGLVAIEATLSVPVQRLLA